MGKKNCLASASSKTGKRLHLKKTRARGSSSSGLRRKQLADDCIFSRRLMSKKYVEELNSINANANVMKLATFSFASASESKSKGKTVQINNNSIPQLPSERLLKIFKVLPTSSLLRLREASRTFYFLATSIYRDRPDSVQLSFSYRDELTRYVSRSYRDDSVGRCRTVTSLLSDFTLMLRRSIQPENSPFTRFHFELPLTQTADLVDFLEVWRCRMKSLGLESLYPNFDVLVGEQVIPLLKILPSLENLTLDKVIIKTMIRSTKSTSTSTCESSFEFKFNFNKFSPLSKFLEGKSGSSHSFPALKCLTLDVYKNALSRLRGSIEWILRRAVNLNRFEIFGPFPLDFSGLSLFVSLGKAHLNKFGQIQVTRENVEMFLREKDFPLAQLLKLESLTIDMPEIQMQQDLWNQHQNQASEVVNKLLEGQKVNLNSLKIVGFLPGLKYPKMKNLNQLSMSSASEECSCACFFLSPPDGDNPTTLWPKLKTVDFGVRLKTEKPLACSFPHLDLQFTSVSTLNLKHESAEYHFKELSNFFPGVQCISFAFRIQNFPKNGPNFWNFHCLKVLKLEIESLYSQNSNLDVVFTGLKLKFLQPFYKMSDEQISKKISINSKPWPKRQRQQSILNLTSLTSLQINLQVKKEDRPTFSKLSWFFAFHLMEQLKRIEITVETGYFAREIQAFNLVDGLKSLERFVTKIN